MAGFAKVVKNRSYFKRYQVKLRRRRQGVTDYYARRKLIAQDKNKYGSKKYRLIVRLTNTKVICQIAYATLAGDVVVMHADSSELKDYGVKVGLTNYAAAYCTGLLCARRMLRKLKMDTQFAGCDKAEELGNDFTPEPCDDKRPFSVVLDIGLKRATTGARIFGAMKGVLDGGVNVPHSVNRFPGYNKESKKYVPEVHRDHIKAVHVAAYMAKLQTESPDLYERQFSKYIAAGITSENLSDIYVEAHKKIRENPVMRVKEKTQKSVKKPQLTKKKQRAETFKKIQLARKAKGAKRSAFLNDICA